METGLVSVDRWGKESQAYFLTHLHSDHTAGLSSRWSRGPLYCSPISARLLPSRFPGFDLTLLRILEVGSTHSISLTSPTTGSEVHVKVTSIDAHHCPGAVMYLFRGEFGCVLHTGDFRWEAKCERDQLGKQMLLDALDGDRVDVLHLDNTYCHHSFSFPPREVAAQQIVDIISASPDHEIIIGIDSLGKEDLLVHISRALNTKIWVWPERLQTMHLLGLNDIFTMKTCLTRVRAVPRYSLTSDTLEELNTIQPTIGIMPSGLPWGVKPFKVSDSFNSPLTECYNGEGAANNMILQERNQICHPRRVHHYAYSVPYSEHACYDELQEFIRTVKPSKVIGIVSSSVRQMTPRHLFCGATEEAEFNKHQDVVACRRCSGLEASKRNYKASTVHIHRRQVLRRVKRGAKISEGDDVI